MNPVQIQPASRPAARPPASEPPTGGDGGDFAQLMALQAPAEEAPQAGRPDEARQARSRHAARPQARAAQPETPRDTPDVAKLPRETAESPRRAEDDAAPLDPALAQWLQSLHRPEAAAEPPSGPTDVTAAPGTERKQPGLPLIRPAAQPADAAVALAGADARASHAAHAARGADKGAREALPSTEAPVPHRPEESPSASASRPNEPVPAVSTGSFALPAGFEPVSAPASGASPVTAETPVPAVPMPVPLESPEFAQAFGLEISVLARDGIQQAELHLNPAEMGPVSVQIALDGEKARIDFGAQAAATRAVIEASLPELAAALRDAGLTLAGGGVSQHAGARDDGRRGEQRDAGSPVAREHADAIAAAPARMPLRSRAGPGGVDLYA